MYHRIIICHKSGLYEEGWIRDIFFAEIKRSVHGGEQWLDDVVAIWRIKTLKQKWIV